MIKKTIGGAAILILIFAVIIGIAKADTLKTRPDKEDWQALANRHEKDADRRLLKGAELLALDRLEWKGLEKGALKLEQKLYGALELKLDDALGQKLYDVRLVELLNDKGLPALEAKTL